MLIVSDFLKKGPGGGFIKEKCAFSLSILYTFTFKGLDTPVVWILDLSWKIQLSCLGRKARYTNSQK